MARNISIGDRIRWEDDDTEVVIPREGTVTAVLSVQLLVKTDDGVDRFVFLNERTLKELGEGP